MFPSIEFTSISLVKLNCKILKQSIMTKVYNVTTYGIADQIKSNLKCNTLIDNNIQIEANLALEIKSNLNCTRGIKRK